jgi:AcrR family transcriptional regulator
MCLSLQSFLVSTSRADICRVPPFLNSHSMSATGTALTPRKSPIQARASVTIGVLHTAAIQVLTQEGLAGCSTTRIAARAGVSVGSLYQYYPNRDALLASVLERHLEDVAVAVERACAGLYGQNVARIAASIVSAFLAVKLGNPDASRALYAIAEGRGGGRLAAAGRARIIAAVAELLAAAPDGQFPDPTLTAGIAVHAMAGPVRAVLEGQTQPGFEAELEDQLTLLLTSYFAARP